MVFAEPPQGGELDDAGNEIVVDAQRIGILLQQYLAHFFQVLAQAQVEEIQAIEQNAVVQQTAGVGTQHQHSGSIGRHLGRPSWISDNVGQSRRSSALPPSDKSEQQVRKNLQHP
ncbi:hypothetical protein D9M72_576590 [compost metagenome]